MPEDPETTAAQAPEPAAPETLASEQGEEIGDFISRQVLDKDSVFFEG